MNQESYEETLTTGRACYYSRSRKKLWRKGEESGNIQEVKSIHIDCDRDAILLKVRQIGGAACHEGYQSCFFRRVTEQGLEIDQKRIFDHKKHCFMILMKELRTIAQIAQFELIVLI